MLGRGELDVSSGTQSWRESGWTVPMNIPKPCLHVLCKARAALLSSTSWDRSCVSEAGILSW